MGPGGLVQAWAATPSRLTRACDLRVTGIGSGVASRGNPCLLELVSADYGLTRQNMVPFLDALVEMP